MDGKQTLAEYLHTLGEIEEMPVLVEKTRKLLKKFVSILEQSGCSKDDYFFQTLHLCETAIHNSTVAERANRSVSSILNTLLVIVQLEYVCQNAINECLATIINIIRTLESSEVVNLPDEIKNKFSHLSICWNKMENLSAMKAIVRIFYEYVSKYEQNDRVTAFKQATQHFHDPTDKLITIIQWTSESFENNCRIFLDNISGKQYFSLASPSAVLGEKALSPLPGCSFIYFDWNHNPAELSFEAAFATDTDNTVQVNIALSDIHALNIIEDVDAPQLKCSYGRIVVVGDSIEAYDLQINAQSNEELRALLQYLEHRVPSQTISTKQLTAADESANYNHESVIFYEKLCKTCDITDKVLDLEEQQQLQQTNATLRKAEDEEGVLLSEGRGEVSVEEIPDVPPREKEEKSDLSEPHYAPLKTTKRSFKFIDLSDDQAKNAHDPYDIAHLRKEERDQKRAKKQANTRGASMTNGNLANGTVAPDKKRPVYASLSTASKRSRAATAQPALNQTMSSNYSTSDDDPSDSNDSDYVPGAKPAEAGYRRRSNRQTTKRKQSFPTARKMVERARGDALKSSKDTIKSQRKTARKAATTRLPICGPEQENFNPSPNVIPQSLVCSSVEKTLKESSHTNRFLDSATPFSHNPIPERILLDNTTSTIRSSGRNGNETLKTGLVPYESANHTTPGSTIESQSPMKSFMETVVLPRILNLQRRYDERMRCEASEAETLANKGSAVFEAFKEKFEALMDLQNDEM